MWFQRGLQAALSNGVRDAMTTVALLWVRDMGGRGRVAPHEGSVPEFLRDT
jgi:hypothetical protein